MNDSSPFRIPTIFMHPGGSFASIAGYKLDLPVPSTSTLPVEDQMQFTKHMRELIERSVAKESAQSEAVGGTTIALPSLSSSKKKFEEMESATEMTESTPDGRSFAARLPISESCIYASNFSSSNRPVGPSETSSTSHGVTSDAAPPVHPVAPRRANTAPSLLQLAGSAEVRRQSPIEVFRGPMIVLNPGVCRRQGIKSKTAAKAAQVAKAFLSNRFCLARSDVCVTRCAVAYGIRRGRALTAAGQSGPAFG